MSEVIKNQMDLERYEEQRADAKWRKSLDEDTIEEIEGLIDPQGHSIQAVHYSIVKERTERMKSLGYTLVCSTVTRRDKRSDHDQTTVTLVFKGGLGQ